MRFIFPCVLSFHQQRATVIHRKNGETLHLEIVVLVDGAASVRGHVSHGSQVHVLTGEQEQVHTAALCHARFGQLLVHAFLRLEQNLEQQQNKTSRLNASAGLAPTAEQCNVLTFSFSVLTSFLSSLFFSLPGASAVGMEEWKMNSFPLHSAPWGVEESQLRCVLSKSQWGIKSFKQ